MFGVCMCFVFVYMCGVCRWCVWYVGCICVVYVFCVCGMRVYVLCVRVVSVHVWSVGGIGCERLTDGTRVTNHLVN